MEREKPKGKKLLQSLWSLNSIPTHSLGNKVIWEWLLVITFIIASHTHTHYTKIPPFYIFLKKEDGVQNMMQGTFFVALIESQIFLNIREYRQKILYGNGELCYSFLNLQIGDNAVTLAFL